MNLLKPALAITICLLAACREPAVSPATEETTDPSRDSVVTPQDPVPAAGPASLVGQSSACPSGSTPFELAPWLGADITVACGLRSERRYVTQTGIARFQVTYEYTAATPQEELDALGNALKAAGFAERVGTDAQPTQRVYVKKGYDSISVWANPERKPGFKNPQANGAIGIDMSDIAAATPTASAN